MIKRTFLAIIFVQVALASAYVTEFVWVEVNPVVAAEAKSLAISVDKELAKPTRPFAPCQCPDAGRGPGTSTVLVLAAGN
ncbi:MULTISPECIES: hypothetical protein [unclassified Mesorhizobium]|uniref:hypothetical protein n=1 Tax=unclassified Mesorhizobium TaxID=325217 RepID=UPI000BAEC29F|nr:MULTISPECIES: hypothetical protein [unclassified Mesorhizobium]TGT61119.1 hypothetical protein EN813_019395 [Mesorhizobium sp. M00.F.Ca.ET.170.01.1.1]AZO08889.1 hypothetical protein EJ074_07020 [Mesorhizobium sp. M3A.F.Ca.ET.080.04.2.1]PBB84247.1 hypothetical protein CK216_24535 [Mesorhizobium sp. WSM3876]RWB67485.1 MAG: hypothetical protein EOQ49_25880 [Mesorhizobium sp.]RWB84643.1 MAG: hypothetical protein EOQ52_24015 [Mesorhizobium sp.]